MSEHKPFAASPNRIARAKREGDRARSGELGAVVAFGFALAGVAVALPFAALRAAGALASAARTLDAQAVHRSVAELLASACVPLLCAGAGSIGAALLGGGIAWSPVRFSAERLAPGAGLKRIVSRDSVVTALRAAVACTAALGVLTPMAQMLFAQAVERGTPEAVIALALATASRASLGALGVGMLFAALDFALSRRRWLEGLRMSHEELRRDLRESEGDPHAKSRRASLHRAIVRGSLSRVREASFVVANPQHVAVALLYDPPRVGVPQVLVRATEELAQRVKMLARAHGVPIVEDVALARALFAGAGVGEAIPRELYVAVAQIVASLLRERVT